MERRLQVPELELNQGRNALSLTGELVLPAPGQQWWQSEFTCNIAAKIGNLTELSALFLPDFKYTAGRATVNGSIRGKNELFYGQLIVAGSGLRWRDAPIENLHAAVNLNGNEIQVANIELFNQEDYVRGRGVVNIFGPAQYWGELRASVDDLGRSTPPSCRSRSCRSRSRGAQCSTGQGEGSARGHSGRFLARLNKVRTLGALAEQLHPINATCKAPTLRAASSSANSRLRMTTPPSPLK
jgi:hypothetical protein